MLAGWKEIREADKIDDLRRTRTLIQYLYYTVQWRNNRVPDLREIMPLPGDPKPAAKKHEGESDEEKARRWYRVARAMKINWGKEKVKFIMSFWHPSWGPPLED